ncbi:16S rRNA (uracil(1498)-N(3))-methyltransferase [Phytohalomonas tamaricis]|uniref:16S rRNA (uracil(1498)-N(3))-methyltransferase n=1 Tax=Phytohalomonas tamaricis TaxID=2081032 RepID=UPI000D0B23C1|nr:16S rRNA (uracil(1498)-N(3))-methyltransferase [Phytohalomonas tamaricis]
MSAPRIHLDATLVAGARLTLSDSAARHVGLVLRKGEGEPLVLFDGRGNEALASIASVDRKRVDVVVEHLREPVPESSLAVHLGQAISKGERMDFAIQKAVELGVGAITPLYAERGEVRLKGDRAAKKLAHWRGVAVSACEQCGRAVVPEICEPQTITEWLARRDEALRLVLHPGEGSLEQMQPPRDAALLIGPEGGLTDAEVASARASGFEALTLGPRILRTETAPIVALSVLQYRFGDLN